VRQGFFEAALHQEREAEAVLDLGILRVFLEDFAKRLLGLGGTVLAEEDLAHPLGEKHFRRGLGLLGLAGRDENRREGHREEPRRSTDPHRAACARAAGAASVGIRPPLAWERARASTTAPSKRF